MADHVEDIKKKKKLYTFIGLILFFFTILTVAVAVVPALDVGGHGFDLADMTLGLAIATVKASLVMLIFMHLNHEKSLIYIIYGVALFMAVALMGLTWWAFIDPMKYGTPTIHEADGGVDGFYVPPVYERD